MPLLNYKNQERGMTWFITLFIPLIPFIPVKIQQG